MIGQFFFALLCIAVLGSGSAAKCDCKCMLKICKENQKQYPADCSMIFQKCQTCGTENCNGEMLTCVNGAKSKEETKKCIDNFYKCSECYCRNKVCEDHAKAHGEPMKCSESLEICRKCNVKQCDIEMGKCMKTIKSHEDLHKCINGWHKCGECMCKYDACKAQSPQPEKCDKGLDLCRRCYTAKCDEDQHRCMKLAASADDKKKCISGWYTCVLTSCH